MKSYHFIVFSFLIVGWMFTIQAQSNENQQGAQEISSEKVEVYYFHNTRRCATCQAIEDITKSTLDEFYSAQLKSGSINFQSLNLEEDATASIAKQLKVSGQSLLVVKSGKKKDLTNDAFMYATSKPDKLKEKIKKAIGTI